MTLLYNMYKPINYISIYSQKLRYMSNGLTLEILNGISQSVAQTFSFSYSLGYTNL